MSTSLPPMVLGRRAVLAGGLALVPGLALARQGFPPPRPSKAPTNPGKPLQALPELFEASGLGAVSGCALADLGSGAMVEAYRADAAFPPASVSKITTTLYALEALGPEYRFRTRLIGTGPVAAGVLQGDLVLAGGGDPVLDTDAAGDLVQALASAGVKSVAGRFQLASGALPTIGEIDCTQPDDADYNPAIAGLNLNFNRVFLGWVPGGAGPRLVFSAPGLRYNAPVDSICGELTAEVRAPQHGSAGGRELWILPRDGLRGRGSIWLPVRSPEPYAGAVFATLAGQAGLRLPAPDAVAEAPAGTELAGRDSDPLGELLRGMLLHSTNLTAEVTGLRATQMRGGAPLDLATSAAAMTDWARARFGLSQASFVNHSGLSDRTRLTPAEQVRILAAGAGAPDLPALLKERMLTGDQGEDSAGARVRWKTGTIDFASALAGYIDGRRGQRLAFAIFAADLAARGRISPDERENPPGAAAWMHRAKAQEQALLRRWTALYA